MKFFAVIFSVVFIALPLNASAETLMDIIYRGDREAHLERMEAMRILEEERSQAYLEKLYEEAAFGVGGISFDDPALKSLDYKPEMENVPSPPTPADAKLKVETAQTNKPVTVETGSGQKFMSGGTLDVQSP